MLESLPYLAVLSWYSLVFNTQNNLFIPVALVLVALWPDPVVAAVAAVWFLVAMYLDWLATSR